MFKFPLNNKMNTFEGYMPTAELFTKIDFSVCRPKYNKSILVAQKISHS